MILALTGGIIGMILGALTVLDEVI